MGLYLVCMTAKEEHINFLQANRDCIPGYLAGERPRRTIRTTALKKSWFRQYTVESETEIEVEVPPDWPQAEPEATEFNCKADFLHLLLSDGNRAPGDVLNLFSVYDDWGRPGSAIVLESPEHDPVFALSPRHVLELRDAISLIDSRTVAERARRSNRGYDESEALEDMDTFRRLIDRASMTGAGLLYRWG